MEIFLNDANYFQAFSSNTFVFCLNSNYTWTPCTPCFFTPLHESGGKHIHLMTAPHTALPGIMHHCTNRCLLATVLACLYLDAAVVVHFSTKIPLCVLEFRCWKVQFRVVIKDAIRSSFISMHWQMLGSSKDMIIYAWQKLNSATYLLHISVDIFSDPGPAIKVWKKKN